MRAIWRSIKNAFGFASSDGAVSYERTREQLSATFDYATRLTLSQQCARLTTFGPYIWVASNDGAGRAHIWTRCYPDVGYFRIYDAVDGRFNLTIQLTTDRRHVERVTARLIEQARDLALEIVDAAEIEDAEPCG